MMLLMRFDGWRSCEGCRRALEQRCHCVGAWSRLLDIGQQHGLADLDLSMVLKEVGWGVLFSIFIIYLGVVRPGI